MDLCSNASGLLNESCVPDYASCADPELCHTEDGGNVGLAFGFTFAAGLTTTIGALISFIPCVKRSNTHFLAAGLALAAGVMLYLSFTDLWLESNHYFCCVTQAHSDLATTCCFFGGILITVALDIAVSRLQQVDCGIQIRLVQFFRDLFRMKTNSESIYPNNPLEMEANGFQKESSVGPIVETDTSQSNGDSKKTAKDGEELDNDSIGIVDMEAMAELGLDKSAKKLKRMGLLTALAISLHNFPEGVATFVATLSSPSLGIVLAIATAIHNIPEGLCVSMPVYYATGSRWKGFLWAFLSGLSELFGALLAYIVLKDLFGPLVYALLFGFISGMMVYISLKELLPTAYKFDKTKGKLVSIFLPIGMLIMALSLVLFQY